MNMRKILNTVPMALGAMTLATAAMADDTLYLNCTCKTAYNSDLGERGCSTTPDFMAIIDLSKSTIDLKSANGGFTKGLFGPAAISAGTISANWNNPGDTLPKKSLSIDRISGAYSMIWKNNAPASMHWTGTCTKTAAPQTQF